jgi:hypothetical protein
MGTAGCRRSEARLNRSPCRPVLACCGPSKPTMCMTKGLSRSLSPYIACVVGGGFAPGQMQIWDTVELPAPICIYINQPFQMPKRQTTVGNQPNRVAADSPGYPDAQRWNQPSGVPQPWIRLLGYAPRERENLPPSRRAGDSTEKCPKSDSLIPVAIHVPWSLL